MLEKDFEFICSVSWWVDVPDSPQPYPYGTRFNFVPSKGGDPRTDWIMMIKRPSDDAPIAPRCQLMNYMTDLGGLVYLSVLFGDDEENLERMTMSFDCRHASNQRKCFYFEVLDIKLPGRGQSKDSETDEKLPKSDPQARGSGRPD